MPRTPASSAPEPTPESAETAATEPTIVYVPAPSYLDRVRNNRMGPLTAALIVGTLIGLLLSILVPSPVNVWALIVLGVLVAGAVGFTVRYLSSSRSWSAQVPAFIGTLLGVHLMGVTGSVSGMEFGRVGQMIGAEGPGFEDALLAALAVPAISTGSVVAALTAAIIAGWGPRDDSASDAQA